MKHTSRSVIDNCFYTVYGLIGILCIYALAMSLYWGFKGDENPFIELDYLGKATDYWIVAMIGALSGKVLLFVQKHLIN
jgi:hypothetical protein